MKKFEIVECTEEWRFWKFNDAKNYNAGDSADTGERRILGSFDTKEEALEALKGYKNSYYYCGCNRPPYVDVEEYFVEENNYDEDGEFDYGGDIWEMADGSGWEVTKQHEHFGLNKFHLEVAIWNGTGYGEWQTIAEESEGWYCDVEEYLQALDRNGFFDEYREAYRENSEDETLENTFFKAVATYGCKDQREDVPLEWENVYDLIGRD